MMRCKIPIHFQFERVWTTGDLPFYAITDQLGMEVHAICYWVRRLGLRSIPERILARITKRFRVQLTAGEKRELLSLLKTRQYQGWEYRSLPLVIFQYVNDYTSNTIPHREFETYLEEIGLNTYSAGVEWRVKQLIDEHFSGRQQRVDGDHTRETGGGKGGEFSIKRKRGADRIKVSVRDQIIQQEVSGSDEPSRVFNPIILSKLLPQQQVLLLNICRLLKNSGVEFSKLNQINTMYVKGCKEFEIPTHYMIPLEKFIQAQWLILIGLNLIEVQDVGRKSCVKISQDLQSIDLESLLVDELRISESKKRVR